MMQDGGEEQFKRNVISDMERRRDLYLPGREDGNRRISGRVATLRWQIVCRPLRGLYKGHARSPG
jgi:hypothetical protein